MQALQIEESVEALRYNQVVLATDADVDGLHIRNLMITFFMRFFEPLVREGHLHILETPSFVCAIKKRRTTAIVRKSAWQHLKNAARPLRLRALKVLEKSLPVNSNISLRQRVFV